MKLSEVLIESSVKTLKSLKGSSIKRFKNLVGKQVGSQLYVHRKYANEVIPNNVLKTAAEKLKQVNPTFKFNSVMWNEFPPTEFDKNEVEDWLIEKGVKNPRHIGYREYGYLTTGKWE